MNISTIVFWVCLGGGAIAGCVWLYRRATDAGWAAMSAYAGIYGGRPSRKERKEDV